MPETRCPRSSSPGDHRAVVPTGRHARRLSLGELPPLRKTALCVRIRRPCWPRSVRRLHPQGAGQDPHPQLRGGAGRAPAAAPGRWTSTSGCGRSRRSSSRSMSSSVMPGRPRNRCRAGKKNGADRPGRGRAGSRDPVLPPSRRKPSRGHREPGATGERSPHRSPRHRRRHPRAVGGGPGQRSSWRPDRLRPGTPGGVPRLPGEDGPLGTRSLHDPPGLLLLPALPGRGCPARRGSRRRRRVYSVPGCAG